MAWQMQASMATIPVHCMVLVSRNIGHPTVLDSLAQDHLAILDQHHEPLPVSPSCDVQLCPCDFVDALPRVVKLLPLLDSTFRNFCISILGTVWAYVSSHHQFLKQPCCCMAHLLSTSDCEAWHWYQLAVKCGLPCTQYCSHAFHHPWLQEVDQCRNAKTPWVLTPKTAIAPEQHSSCP